MASILGIARFDMFFGIFLVGCVWQLFAPWCGRMLRLLFGYVFREELVCWFRFSSFFYSLLASLLATLDVAGAEVEIPRHFHNASRRSWTMMETDRAMLLVDSTLPLALDTILTSFT